jgi:phage tail sheath protein FI
MAALISPGVSVTVTDQSFFFPTAAATVPLIFIATRANKRQADGVSTASGTLESGVVRTITSVTQSLQLYGVPYFHTDIAGQGLHGDARNEYGLFTLNNFLGIGNRAFVVRANVDLNDQTDTFMSLGTPVAENLQFVGMGSGYSITGIAAGSSLVKTQTITVTFSSPTSFGITGSVSGYITAGNVGQPLPVASPIQLSITAGVPSSANPTAHAFVTGDKFTFDLVYAAVAAPTNTGDGRVANLRTDALLTTSNWTITFSSPTTYSVSDGISTPDNGVIGSPFDNNKLNFTVLAGATPFVAGDEFDISAAQVSITSPLGSTDLARRGEIAKALRAAIGLNVEIRSELYEYNLIVCPGNYDVAASLIDLANSIHDEAFVLLDTPCDLNPEQVTSWAMTSKRQGGNGNAYYYPWAIQSNLDGALVLVPPTAVALRTLAFSDDQSYVWFAPAGTARGRTFGIQSVGYVTGTLGTATTFIETNLNQGQRDDLYIQGHAINPITFFPGRGTLVWGQKTSQYDTSAMDRINVVRGVMFLRRVLRKGAMPFVFEPNDQITRDNLKAAADALLSDMMVKRGLYDFATYCDGTNNTPTVIDNNQLILDIAIKPTRAAEFISIPIRVVATSATI